MRKKNKLIIAISLLVFALLMVCMLFNLFGVKQVNFGAPISIQEKGRLDISAWDLNNGNIKLDGNWDFYWNQLIAPAYFNNAEASLTGAYRVPMYWTKYQNLNLPAKGYATYRIVINTDKTYNTLSLKTPEVYTEYCLWVNGKKLDGNGSLYNNVFTYLRPDVITFANNSNIIEIVLQVKNEAHINAGIGQSFVLGTTANIYREKTAETALDLIISVICLLACSFSLVLFAYNKRNFSMLCFAIFCFAVAVRGVMSNGTYIMQVFPQMPFIVGSRLITALIPIILASVLLYTFFIYRDKMPKYPMLFLESLNVAYLWLVLSADTYIYSMVFKWYMLVAVAVCLLIFYTAVRAIISGEKDAIVFLSAGIFLIASAFNDMLYFNQQIDTGYWLGLGLAIFVLVQSITMIVRFSHLTAERAALYDKLRETDLAFMQAQIKPHFIYNALNAISNTIVKEPQMAKELLLDFSDYLRGCFRFDNTDGMTTLGKEMELVKAYLAIEKARFRERLNVEYSIEENPYVLIPVLCIQPIVENAVCHGLMEKLEGGTVKISVWHENDATRIRVEDDGIGISQEKIAELLCVEKKGGVGIANINSRLKIKYGVGLEIVSVINEGTVVEITIPHEKSEG